MPLALPVALPRCQPLPVQSQQTTPDRRTRTGRLRLQGKQAHAWHAGLKIAEAFFGLPSGQSEFCRGAIHFTFLLCFQPGVG
jgi:hypothetical protein